MKGISRIDTKGTHGWYVRIYRAGRTYSKLYSDNKYGGTDKALEFAKKARKVAQEKLDSTIGTRSRRLVTHDKRNKSGIIGVSRTTKKKQPAATSACTTRSPGHRKKAKSKTVSGAYGNMAKKKRSGGQRNSATA